jgi:diguanylate cyclase (GGDEF)-like protein
VQKYVLSTNNGDDSVGYWIAVVDDDALLLRSAKDLLEGYAMRVSPLRSGAALLKFMETNTPDLVVLDILMPDMDGFETFHALRALEEKLGRHATPVIFLSGENDTAAERRGLRDGASDFVRKPIDKDIFISRIFKTIESHKTIELLTEKATLDKLTGFMNKASGIEKITEICQDHTGAMLLFDLDNFKLVNDIYGHDMGDQVLIAFSEIVKHNTREEDVISRIGGDEFLGFFGNITSENAVKSLTDRLNDQILNKCVKLMGEEFDLPIGISVGAAFVPKHTRDYATLFKCADTAMYRAKESGKHGAQIYDEEIYDKASEDESDLEADLSRLSRIMEERGEADGAMVMGKETFYQIYRFSIRFLSRYKKGAEKILFNLSVDEDENLSDFTKQFIEMLKNKLRKSDAIVQIKSDQILVFLPIITEEEGKMVAGRIEKAFAEMDAGSAKMEYIAEHVSFESNEE